MGTHRFQPKEPRITGAVKLLPAGRTWYPVALTHVNRTDPRLRAGKTHRGIMPYAVESHKTTNRDATNKARI